MKIFYFCQTKEIIINKNNIIVDLKKITSQFTIQGEIAEVAPLGTGLINDTFRVKTSSEKTPDYVLQRINLSLIHI